MTRARRDADVGTIPELFGVGGAFAVCLPGNINSSGARAPRDRWEGEVAVAGRHARVGRDPPHLQDAVLALDPFGELKSTGHDVVAALLGGTRVARRIQVEQLRVFRVDRLGGTQIATLVGNAFEGRIFVEAFLSDMGFITKPQRHVAHVVRCDCKRHVNLLAFQVSCLNCTAITFTSSVIFAAWHMVLLFAISARPASFRT